jgi:hypothetical protein
MNRDEELAKLIREQQRDDTDHIYNPIGLSLTAMANGEWGLPREQAIPCPVHGMGQMRRWGGTNRCSACNREADERRRRREGMRPRWEGCARHGLEAWHVTPGGHGYCKIERRWRRIIRTRRERGAA